MTDQKSPALLTISLEALRANYRQFCAMTGAKVAGVLKADGYGTGAKQAYDALIKEGCDTFFVATPDEAAELRALDKAPRILVLGGLYRGAEEFYAAENIEPVLNSLEEIARWKQTALRLGRKLPATVHIDTGMNRLGLEEADVKTLADDRTLLDGIDLKLVMSHFACSDEKDHLMNNAQALLFEKLSVAFPSVPRSLCNSSGLYRNKNWHYDLVRPGFALYGGNPMPEVNNPVRPVVDLSVRILQIRDVKAGETAGYGASHTFQNDTSVVTLSVGYADGFLRSGSNRTKLFWQGQPCPIVGRISMDLIIVDIGGLKTKPVIGDWLEILGPSQSVDDLAADCGTIGYEILTSLGPRYHRIYK